MPDQLEKDFLPYQSARWVESILPETVHQDSMPYMDAKWVESNVPDNVEDPKFVESIIMGANPNIVSSIIMGRFVNTSMGHSAEQFSPIPSELRSTYNNFKQLGQGSFATVFQAERISDGLKVAIKLPNKVGQGKLVAGDCDKIQKISDNVKGNKEGNKVGGRHIMECYEKGNGYVVLQWAGTPGDIVIEGQSLHQMMALLKQVVFALYAFEKASPPIVHHDLKWNNVAVDDQNCLRLIDLDSSVEGTWQGHTQDITTCELFAPPEFFKSYEAFYCGLSTASQTVCPLSYSWDMFTVGQMAVEMCGLEYLFFQKYFDTRLDGTTNQKADTVKTRAYYLFAEPKDIMRLWGLQQLRDDNYKFKKLLREIDNNGYNNILQTASKLDADVSDKVQRLKACQSLGDAQLAELEKMIAPDPWDRPLPSKLLQSPLMVGVETGCALDNGVTIEQDYLSDTDEGGPINHVPVSLRVRKPDMYRKCPCSGKNRQAMKDQRGNNIVNAKTGNPMVWCSAIKLTQGVDCVKTPYSNSKVACTCTS